MAKDFHDLRQHIHKLCVIWYTETIYQNRQIIYFTQREFAQQPPLKRRFSIEWRRWILPGKFQRKIVFFGRKRALEGLKSLAGMAK